jgi:hypothetical protein
LILESVHAVEMPFSAGSVSVFASSNLLGSVQAIRHGHGAARRYCSDECRQSASIINHAAKLLTVLSDEETLTVLKVFQGD